METNKVPKEGRKVIRELQSTIQEETLEEAAERLQKDKYGIFISKDADVKGQLVIDTANAAFLSGMIEGAKWQQEQDKKKYSEEDMRKAFKDGSWVTSWSDMGIEMKYDTFEQWFKQFKKK